MWNVCMIRCLVKVGVGGWMREIIYYLLDYGFYLYGNIEWNKWSWSRTWY